MNFNKDLLVSLKWPMTIALCTLLVSAGWCNQSCQDGMTDRTRVQAEMLKTCMNNYTDPVELAVCSNELDINSTIAFGNYKEYVAT
jgi:hypothetical protein